MRVGEVAAEVSFETLEARLRVMLPEIYREREEEVQPVSMGSAGLRFGVDGKVAWDEIWGSFCDLAMAGGPPHRGTLLEAGGAAGIEGERVRYGEVVEEICRGVGLVTGLWVEASEDAGWVKMYCTSVAMAGWLARAIVMENVSASARGLVLHLPAGPEYRVEKEIRNVVTAVAKTCHYWAEHTPVEQQWEMGRVLREMESESAVVEPGVSGDAVRVGKAIEEATGLVRSGQGYAGWVGLECVAVSAAIWMMRVLVVSNVFSRREGTVVFVPVNADCDLDGARVVAAVGRAVGYGRVRGII